MKPSSTPPVRLIKKEENVNTSTLIEIVSTRIRVEYDNYTQRTFLREIMKALLRLREYEKRDPIFEEDK